MTEPFDPDYVIAPGETLADWFKEMNLPKTISNHYDIDRPTLDGILSGEREIDAELAQKLCNMTHVGAPFWLALEHNFRVGLAAGKKWVK